MTHVESYYIIKREANSKLDYLYLFDACDIEKDPLTTVIERSAMRIETRDEADNIMLLLTAHYGYIKHIYSLGVHQKNTWYLVHVTETSTIVSEG